MEGVRPEGGLKLHLQGDGRDDRRIRFASICVTPAGASDELWLVTDAQGRLGYRLAAGEYRLRSEHAPESRFRVDAHGWTTVNLSVA
jgi:hypothetical protein